LSEAIGTQDETPAESVTQDFGLFLIKMLTFLLLIGGALLVAGWMMLRSMAP